ncbi:MAG: hypothetical protein PHW56_00860 [Methanosarcinaceae archaeon]|nr:hypothetical protein [Methanosarcinaceae archaeon]
MGGLTICPITAYKEGFRDEINGWVCLHIEGGPYERGFQHGYLMAPEIKEIMRSIEYLTYWDTGKKWEFFVEAARDLWLSPSGSGIDEEFLAEMQGIAAGAREAGVKITWEEVLAWNGYEELTGYWWPLRKEGKFSESIRNRKDHCSAFIATAPYTGGATAGERSEGRGGERAEEKDGPEIVMAHNTWSNFETGQFCNLVLDIKPARGQRIFMQAYPGYIHSMTDFFVTGAGLMGTETTIGGFNCYDPDQLPEFFRVRKAMQYSESPDRFVEFMKQGNNGGYANTWYLGDINSGEILRFELGLEYNNVSRKKEGYFIGFNAPLDPRIRNLECSNTGYADIRRHQGARQVRLEELMEEYRGRINVESAKKIIADHYDVYLKKRNNPCSRTVDGHYELDARESMSQPGRPLPFQPRGAVDGKVMDSRLAKEFAFWGRWGNSSGIPFEASEFLKEHIQWKHLDGYLKDRPSQPWTLFKAKEIQ